MESIIKDYVKLKKALEDKYILIGEEIENKNSPNERFIKSVWLTPGGILEVTAPSEGYIQIEFNNKPFRFNCTTRTADIKKE